MSDPHFDGVIFKTHGDEIRRRMRHAWPPFLLIDVRDAAEWTRGHIAGSVSLTLDETVESLPEGTDAATEFIVVGSDQNDARVRKAADRLRELGARRVVEYPGGMYEWRAFGLPTESGPAAG